MTNEYERIDLVRKGVDSVFSTLKSQNLNTKGNADIAMLVSVNILYNVLCSSLESKFFEQRTLDKMKEFDINDYLLHFIGVIGGAIKEHLDEKTVNELIEAAHKRVKETKH